MTLKYINRGGIIRVEPVPTSDWVFKYQPKASNTLTQPSLYKKAEKNLLEDEKGPKHGFRKLF